MQIDDARSILMFRILKEQKRFNKFLFGKMEEFYMARSPFWSIFISYVDIRTHGKECKIYVVPWFLSNLKKYENLQYFLNRTLQGDGVSVVRQTLNELIKKMK